VGWGCASQFFVNKVCCVFEGQLKADRDNSKGLRYKDFRLVAKPARIESSRPLEDRPGLFETAGVSEFAEAMKERGNSEWFERAMGFS
jgi:hypothetical protein